MEPFLLRLLVVIGVIWLVQTVLSTFSIKEPANKLIFGVTVIVGVVFLLFGSTVLTLR